MEQPITPLDQASCWMRRSDLHASLAWATLGEIQFPVEVDLGVKNRREHWRVMLALLVPRHQVARDAVARGRHHDPFDGRMGPLQHRRDLRDVRPLPSNRTTPQSIAASMSMVCLLQ
jgi:hypothetical protein